MPALRQMKLTGCQVSRFLVLHKELDADDGELTRTRKVRRNVIEDKFKDLIDAMYDGKDELSRKPKSPMRMAARGRSRPLWKFVMRNASQTGRRRHDSPAGRQARETVTADGRIIGGTVMEMRNITLRFGGVVAIQDITFDIRQGKIRAIIGPNGAGKSSMLNVINGFYHPQEERSGTKAPSADRCVRIRLLRRASPVHFRTSRCSMACRRWTTSTGRLTI